VWMVSDKVGKVGPFCGRVLDMRPAARCIFVVGLEQHFMVGLDEHFLFVHKPLVHKLFNVKVQCRSSAALYFSVVVPQRLYSSRRHSPVFVRLVPVSSVHHFLNDEVCVELGELFLYNLGHAFVSAGFVASDGVLVPLLIKLETVVAWVCVAFL